MKKRILSLVLCLVMVFSLMPFTALAAVYEYTPTSEPRLKVVFHDKSGEEHAVEYIKKSDLADINTIIYEPDVGQLGDREIFRGWTTSAGYTAETVPMTIEDVRTAVTEKLNGTVTDNEAFHVYPVIFKAYTVTYIDEQEAAIWADSVLLKANETSKDYEVTQTYTPMEQNEQFQGWLVYGENNTNLNRTVQKGDTLTFGTGGYEQNIQLRASAPTGHWLIFNRVQPNATYNAPQFVKDGANTQPVSDPTCIGYTFDGWYKDEACTQRFTFGGQLSGDQPLYAKWNQNTKAAYTIVIWKQKTVGDGYDYGEAVTVQNANVGSSPNVTSHGSGNNAYATVNGVNKQYTGFHLKEYDSGKTVAPEGNTVVNVYYDRNVYTLTFQRDTGVWFSNWTTIYTINARYEAPIGDNFPITVNGQTLERGVRWAPQNSSTYSQVLVYIDKMPAESITFHYNHKDNNSSYGLKTMNYYVESLPGTAGDVTVGGVKYDLHKSIDAMYGMVTEAEDFMPLTGFTQSFSNPAFSGGEALVGGADETINFYYTRDKYKITFKDGSYFAGKTNDVDQNLTPKAQSHESDDIFYQADISQYSGLGTNPATENWWQPYEGYTFAGWYLDETCTVPAVFDKMPQGGLTVYAKWIKTQYRVFMHTNLTSSDYVDWGNNTTDLSFCFRVDYLDKVSLLHGERNGYELVGWYTDEAFENGYNGETLLTGETVKTDYNKSVDMTDTYETANGTGVLQDPKFNSDLTGYNGGDRFWITKKLDLYAKWRSELIGATGIRVQYVPGEGTWTSGGQSAQLDVMGDIGYKDTAIAIGRDAGVTAPEGKRFQYWVLQEYKNGEFTDTTTHVYPGQEFEVLKAQAQDVTVDADHHTYTVQLRAEYAPIGAKSTVPLVIDPNGGTLTDAFKAALQAEIDAIPGASVSFEGGKATISNFPINQIVTLPDVNQVECPDCELVGWTTQRDTENLADATFAPGTKVGSDLQNRETNNNTNTVYALWKAYPVTTYLIDFNAPMKVATDVTKDIKDQTHNNGTFTKTNTDVTYQLSMTGTVNSGTATLTTAYSAVDSAVVYGKAAGKDAVAWNKITTIPANSIYFDDDILNTTLTADDQSGYTDPSELPAYNAVRKDTDDGKVQLFYTFTGTGIDVYCTTKSDGGYVSAALFKGGIVESTGKPNMDKSNRVGDIVTMKNYSVDERYNVPTIHFVAPECGTYTLMFSIPKNANYYLDGIRVYNAVSDQALYTDNGAEAEANASFFNLRDLLVNGESSYNVTVDASKLNAAEGVNMSNYDQLMSQISNGILFIDGADKIPTVNKKDDGSLGGIYETAFDAYKANGPKNEIYLSQGQSIAFTVMNYQALKNEGAKFQIGLSAPDKNKNTATVSGVSQTTVSSQLDMYYDLVPNKVENGAATFIIKNEGQNLISVTDLKVSGSANKLTLPAGATAKVMAVEDAEPAGETTLNVAVNGLTMRAMLISVNPDLDDTASEPVEEPTEEPTTQQTIRDILRQILSDFVSRLFGSIGHLFGH